MKELKISPTSYETVEVSNIIPNSWNPNVMNDKDFKKLKENIDKSWWNYEQPILLRKLWKKYEIIDGYHRYKAMVELGFSDVYARVEELSDKDARVKTIQMNRFRGEFDTVKLATLIRDLKESYALTNNDLNAYLGFEPEEIMSLESFLDFNAEEFIRIKEEKEEKIEIAEEITWDEGIIIEVTQEELDKMNSFSMLTMLPLEKALYSAIAMYKEDIEKNWQK